MERKKQAEVRRPVKKLYFDSNLPGLLEEVLNNQTCAILKIPINITRALLGELAQLAIEIDDPRLHLMMIRLGLYDFRGGGDHVRQKDEMEKLVKAYEDDGDRRVTWNTPGLRAFLRREAHGEGDLMDWYQHSVDTTVEPVWTDKHIEEVVKDYWLIPKPIKKEKFSPKKYYEDLLDDPVVQKNFKERHGYELKGKGGKNA